MIFNINRLAVAAVAALSVVGAMPAEKAVAQLVGAGSTSIFPLTGNSNDGTFPGPLFVGQPVDAYRSIGSGAGRAEFEAGITDFAVTSARLLPEVSREQIVIINPFDVTLAIPYNVPGFDARLTVQQACGIVGGAVTNWNQVGGPDLPVIRVIRGDISGATDTHDSGFTVPICGFGIFRLDGQPSFPNPNPSSDIFVNGSQGAIAAIQSIPGAFGYVDRSTAAVAGLPVAVNVESGLSEVAVAPEYVVFRRDYGGDVERATAARNLCNYLVTSGRELAINTFGYAVPSQTSDSCDGIIIPE